MKGFGIRVTCAGSKAFVLNYRTRAGRERRYTIGAFPDWGTAAARTEAKRLKQQIHANGADPVGELQSERNAPTVADLCRRYVEEHLPKKRPLSQADDRYMLRQWVASVAHLKVADVGFSDIDALHRRIARETPIRANRVLSLLSKMFSLAIRWRWRMDNPCRGVQRNQERKRTRYLTADELVRLTTALNTFPDEQAANAIRLLLLTGARRGEVIAARWADFDLEAGVSTEPEQRPSRRPNIACHCPRRRGSCLVPCSAPTTLRAGDARRSGGDGQAPGTEFLFPGKGEHHRVDLKRPWPALCKAAGIKGVRIHDLRHTYASVLASAGQSLHVIGALLGHTQPATTARYAHLVDDPLRAATESAGAIISGKPKSQGGEGTVTNDNDDLRLIAAMCLDIRKVLERYPERIVIALMGENWEEWFSPPRTKGVDPARTSLAPRRVRDTRTPNQGAIPHSVV